MSNSAPNLESLVVRIEKLESQNRRWKLAAALVAIASASLVLGGAKLPDRVDQQVLRAHTVEAQEFVVKDEDGHVYARLSMYSDRIEINGRAVDVGPGAPSLQFYGDNGKPVWTAPQKPIMVPATR